MDRIPITGGRFSTPSEQLRGGSSLLLLSGLPLERKPSFLWQLQSLADALRRRGLRVVVGGPVSSGPLWQGWQLDETPRSFVDLVDSSSAESLIALGYPDQFPLRQAADRGVRCFLWAQVSRPTAFTLPAATTLVPLTEQTAAFLRSGGCTGIAETIPHGVDTRLFTPRAGGRRGASVVLGSVGANSRRKRFDLILRAFALFSRRYPSSRLILKTDRVRSLDGVDLRALAAAEGVADRVEILLETLDPGALAGLYRRLDLYINLSEWEGFCIPVIEAMACGIPVICPPIQGPSEILPYQDTVVPAAEVRLEQGTRLHRADPDAVCEMLDRLAGDAALRLRLARQGREAVLRTFGIRRIAALWEQLLQTDP